MSGGLILMANLSTVVLMPRFGPKPLVASGMLVVSGGTAWLAQLGQHTGYATGVLVPLILAGTSLLNTIFAGAVAPCLTGISPRPSSSAARP
jgi:hypothetical protein